MEDYNGILAPSLADVVVYIREGLLTAVAAKDEPQLDEVFTTLHAIEEAIIALRPEKGGHLLLPIDHMISGIQDYYHGVTWKTTIPTSEEIREAFAGKLIERLRGGSGKQP